MQNIWNYNKVFGLFHSFQSMNRGLSVSVSELYARRIWNNIRNILAVSKWVRSLWLLSVLNMSVYTLFKKKSFILFFENCSRHLKNYSHKLSTIDLMFQYIEYISRLPLCSFTPKIFCAFVRQTTKIRKIVFIFKFHYSLSVLTF